MSNLHKSEILERGYYAYSTQHVCFPGSEISQTWDEAGQPPDTKSRRNCT